MTLNKIQELGKAHESIDLPGQILNDRNKLRQNYETS